MRKHRVLEANRRLVGCRGVDEKKADTSAALDNNYTINDPLVRVLVAKGLLTVDEALSVNTTGTALNTRSTGGLVRDKGLISATEFEAVRNVATVQPSRHL